MRIGCHELLIVRGMAPLTRAALLASCGTVSERSIWSVGRLQTWFVVLLAPHFEECAQPFAMLSSKQVL